MLRIKIQLNTLIRCCTI